MFLTFYDAKIQTEKVLSSKIFNYFLSYDLNLCVSVRKNVLNSTKSEFKI